jgi:putative membrane protein
MTMPAPVLAVSETPAASMSDVLAWHPHFDVWALLFVLGFGYWYAIRRIAPHVVPEGEQVVSKAQVRFFVAGLVVMWIASDWPIHDLAEESMFSFHMFEHMILGLVVPPLLILGTPKWMARLVLGGKRVLPVIRQLAKPIPAFFIFNIMIIGIHWPQVVELMVRNSTAHFLIHAAFFLASINAWLPVFSPMPEIPKMAPPIRMLYLFLHSLGPTVPASFLTFGTEPIYPAYVSTPKLWGMDAIIDQTVAGLVMKLGGGVVIWTIIAILWFQWYAEEKEWDRLEDQLRRTPS